MDLPVAHYEDLPDEQYRPTGWAALLAGLQNGLQTGLNIRQTKENINQQKLADQLTKIQLQYAPQMAQQKLQESQLANALSQNTLNYAPQTSQAELALKNIQAQTAPLQALGSYYGGMGRFNQASWNSSPNSQLLRLSNNPQFQALVSSNPQVAQQLTQVMQAITQSAGNNAQGAPQGALPLSTNQINALKAAVSPQDVNAVQQAAGDSFIHKTQTAAQQNQRLYANTLDSLFDMGDSQVPDFSQYAGFTGKTKRMGDAIASAFGHTSPQYSNYLSFTRQTMPAIANEIRRTLGGQATDQESKLMSSIANPDHWDSNPQQTMKEYQTLKSLLQTKIGPKLAQSPFQLQQNLQQPQAQHPAASQMPNEEDIAFTAKKYGLTRAQVLQRLGVQNAY